MESTLRKTRFAWYLYDWANSAFVTSVITVFLGPFLTTLASNVANENGEISLFGLSIYSESLFSYVVSISVLLQVFLLPIIGSIADIKNQRKNFLYLFAYAGSILAISLFFLTEKTLFIGIVAFILANIFFGASVVMYNSLLIDIADSSERDKISLNGWAFGYIGGGILLAINLLTIFFHNRIGISYEFAIRLSLGSAGFWWLIFSIISQINLKLPKRQVYQKEPITFGMAFASISKTFKKILNDRNALLFFIAYIFYNDGVQTVIVVSTQFGKRELNLGMDFLVLVVLFVQFASFFGTLLVMKIDQRIKSKKTLILCLFVWSFTVVFAYFFLKDAYGFVILALLISLVLGGTQAISRSVFSRFIPENMEAEYFSFYEITEKGSSWIGPLFFGIILQLTKSYRLAILSLILFFLLGIFLLLKVKINANEVGVSK
ncbi:MAG: putative MFS-type transporter [Candidatus Kapaibacterium sp.]|nr:MAG: putative MFS-type transporter [Candidatus Kapabacteria bacterium]